MYLQWCLFFTGCPFLVATGHKSCYCDYTSFLWECILPQDLLFSLIHLVSRGHCTHHIHDHTAQIPYNHNTPQITNSQQQFDLPWTQRNLWRQKWNCFESTFFSRIDIDVNGSGGWFLTAHVYSIQIFFSNFVFFGVNFIIWSYIQKTITFNPYQDNPLLQQTYRETD